MANDLTSNPGVMKIDSTADNIVAAGSPVKVWKARLVAAAAAATALIFKAGGTVDAINLAAVIGSSDLIEFYERPIELSGLKVTMGGAGALLYLYTEPN